jgi:hypothetical protein
LEVLFTFVRSHRSQKDLTKTGACALGVKNFVEQKGIKQTKYSPKEISIITK